VLDLDLDRIRGRICELHHVRTTITDEDQTRAATDEMYQLLNLLDDVQELPCSTPAASVV
jgi:hypothetical protein